MLGVAVTFWSVVTWNYVGVDKKRIPVDFMLTWLPVNDVDTI